ncbi:MAG: biotin--[acetyl-CoA-carboxylase] ligase [Planctomycetota bacterium]
MSPLDLARLETICSECQVIGSAIRVLQETDSTNDRCQELAGDPQLDGLVIFAEHQTAGRGQRGSIWSAPPGSGLLFSILLHPKGELAQPNFLTAFAALAIVEQLQESYRLDARIKWPNDVLANGCKTAGILVERGVATVIGVGLNVSIKRTEFPANLRMPATSIEEETGHVVDRTELAGNLLRRLDGIYAEARQFGARHLWPRWEEYLESFGDGPVVATTRRERIVGRLVGLRPDRGARVARGDGTLACIPPEELIRVERDIGGIGD